MRSDSSSERLPDAPLPLRQDAPSLPPGEDPITPAAKVPDGAPRPEPRRGAPASADAAALLALREELRAAGLALGFSRVGFAPPTEPEGVRERLLAWLADGRHATMAWMARNPESRVDPATILEGARCVIVVSLVYATRAPVPAAPGLPRISRYAQGQDYHAVLGDRLHALRARLEERAPGVRTRLACDTSPIAEKAFAVAGGLGWIGKNTCLLHPRLGSFTFLGEIFTDLALPPDAPIPDRCGSCTRCLDACPTGAFPQPYVLDANRCIASWNIEHRGDFAPGWAEAMGDWLVGCDICQEVCPWNRKAPETDLPELLPDPAIVERTAAEWEALTDEEYRATVRGRALSRVKAQDMRRNARAVRANGDHAPS